MNILRTPKLKTFFDEALDFLFPAPASVDQLGQTFKNLSVEESAHELLQTIPKSEPNEIGATTLFAYSNEKAKHLVWEIKYYKNEKLANIVGFLLAKKIIAQVTAQMTNRTPAQFLLVPIPLTSKRLRERGFNHTELITSSVLRYLQENAGLTFELAPDTLRKIRHTPKQNSIENRQDRFTNIRGAFAVDFNGLENESENRVDAVQSKNIILIDDVLTTGATLTEAKRALMSAGVTNVLCFAIAH